MTESRLQSPSLMDWVAESNVSDEMFWKEAAGQQVLFVRDKLAPLFGSGLEYRELNQVVRVISTHQSKSIELPVYQLERPDRDIRIILRNNFYNWKMTVLSSKPIDVDFDGLFHTTPPTDPEYTGNPLNPVYFEGFPQELIFPYYSETDGARWSAEIQTDEELWASMFLIMRALGIAGPLTWNKRESHRRELGLLDT